MFWNWTQYFLQVDQQSKYASSELDVPNIDNNNIVVGISSNRIRVHCSLDVKRQEPILGYHVENSFLKRYMMKSLLLATT